MQREYSLDTPSRGTEHVVLLAEDQDGRTDDEDNGREEEGQPETDILHKRIRV